MLENSPADATQLPTGCQPESLSLDAMRTVALTVCACWERSIGWPSASLLTLQWRVRMQPPPASTPTAATKKLLREGRSGALATLMPGSGDPYCSLVNVATAADGAPLLLISRLAVHTKNILADPRVSLMIDERKAGDPLQGARIMLM